jgi:16S rRNA (guanine(1405)-N(7))-methyltransferase
MDNSLDQLVTTVLSSPKYQAVSEDFVRNIGAQELSKRRNLREAIKATKNKLHQVGGAYFDDRVDYASWLGELRTARHTSNHAVFMTACQQIMRYHSSTRERLPELDLFYKTTLADLSPIRSVLDVACGLNPLAIPWMPLAKDAEYYAVDIYQDMINFVNDFFILAGVRGMAEVGDVIGACPAHKVEVAYMLKTIPCLEQVDKSAGPRLLDSIQADHLLISFPVHSLGGRYDKGMLQYYESRFRSMIGMITEKQWTVKRYVFATELVFRVSK